MQEACPLEWTEEAKVSWLAKLKSHESKWVSIPVRYNVGASQKALKELDSHLNEYDEFPAFSDKYNAMTGEGNLRPKILFVLPSPTYFDHKCEKVFSHENRDFLARELANVKIDDKDCHFAYVFPMSLDPTVELGNFERALFLPYFRRRIHILRPKVIVCIGGKTKEFIDSAFSVRPTRNRSIRIDNKDGVDLYNLEIDSLKAKGLHAPHPFCVRQAEDKLSYHVKKWEACLSSIEKICNPIPTPGKTFIDKSGTEKKDATQFLMSRSRAAFSNQKKSPAAANLQKRGISNSNDNHKLFKREQTNIMASESPH